MATVQEAVRRLTIVSTDRGLTETERRLRGVQAAQQGVTVASQGTERATLSLQRRVDGLSRQYDRHYRATATLTKVERDLSAAHAQGLITLQRKNQLMALATAQTDRATVATGRLAAAQRGLSATGGAALGAVGLGGGGAAVGGILAAGYALSAFIKNTIEAQKTLAQLEAAIRSTGGAAGLTSGELTAMASELQRVTTYGDDAVISAQAMLLTFTSVGREVFPQAVRAILDVSTAMGQDLKSSTVQVGKALNDPVKGISALTRVGIQFTEAQKLMIKSLAEANDMAGAQRIILAELERQFGGSAVAARETLGGALTALGNAFGDLFEVSREGSSNLTNSINTLTDTLSDPATIKAIQDFGGALFDELSAALGMLQAFIRDIKAVVAFFDGIQAQAKAIREGLGLEQAMGGTSILGGAITFGSAPEEAERAVNIFDSYRETLVETATATQQVAAETETLGKALGKAADVPLPRMRPEIDNIVEGLERAEGAAKSFAESLVGGLAGGKGIIGSLTDAISGLTSTLGTTLGNKVSGLIGGSTSGIFGSILSGLGGGLVSSVVSGIGSLFKSIFGGNDEEERAARQLRRQERRDKIEARKERLEEKEEKRLARQEARARRMEGYSDRAFMAGLDTSTLEGRLAQFDLEAQREREQVLRDGGKKANKELAALDQALAAERLQILRDFNDDMIAEAKAAAEEMNRQALSIVEYVNGLKAGGDSPLSPTDRFAAAGSAYQAQIALAQGGNASALGSITQYSDAYLKAAREMYASSEDFFTIFDTVTAQLLALPTVQGATDPAVAAMLEVLAAVLDQTTVLQAQTLTLQGAIDAGALATANALAPIFEDLDIDVSGGLTLAEMQAALGTTNDRLLSIFNELDVNGNGTISRLELLAKDASIAGLAKDSTIGGVTAAVGTVNTSLVDTTNGLPAVNTNVGKDDGSGLKSKLKDINSTMGDVKGGTKWLPVIAQRLYEVALFTGQAKGVKEKPKKGDDRTAYANKDNFLGFSGGGIIPGLADGGLVGNGMWNQDSVRARYAGGGDIMLAGGEGVINAAATSMIGPSVIDLINRTGRLPDNDNGQHFATQNRVLMAGFRAMVESNEALHEEVRQLRAEARGTTRAIERKPVPKQATKAA